VQWFFQSIGWTAPLAVFYETRYRSKRFLSKPTPSETSPSRRLLRYVIAVSPSSPLRLPIPLIDVLMGCLVDLPLRKIAVNISHSPRFVRLSKSNSNPDRITL